MDRKQEILITRSLQLVVEAQDAQDAQDAQGQWELALFLFSDRSDDHTDLIGESSFGAAISACAFAAKWSTAVALLRQCSALER